MQNKQGTEFFLDEITLINFKGAKNRTIPFKDHATTIKGDNKIGKTTVYDGFLWLLFGKDSNDSAVFDIKPRDLQGKESSQIDSIVSIKFRINGTPHTAKKILREKWVRKTGADVATMEGNTNIYEWDETVIKAGEFENKIKSIFDETMFRLITNTKYFASLKKDQRREILTNLAGTITNDDVFKAIASTGEDMSIFENLKTYLKENPVQSQAVGMFRNQIRSKIATIKEQFEKIPTRIDETERVLKSAENVQPKENLLSETERLTGLIHDADTRIGDRAAANKLVTDKIEKQNNEISSKQITVDNIYNSIQRELNEQKNRFDNMLSGCQSDIKQIDNEIFQKGETLERLNTDIINTTARQTALRNQWQTINSQQFIPGEFKFDSDEFSCPTCHRVFENVDIEAKKTELQTNFDEDQKVKKQEFLADKRKKLDDNKSRGMSMNDEVIAFQKNIDEIKIQITALNVKKTSLIEAHGKAISDRQNPIPIDQLLNANEDYVKLVNEIRDLKASREVLPTDDLEALKRSKIEYNASLNQVQSQLHIHDSIDKANERIVELKAQQEKLAQDMANLERIEKSIRLFVTSKMNTVTERINGMFEFVKFRMFNTLLNGAIEDDCEIMIDGVPYPSANHAAQINAGLDIINTLCREYHINAPCFIDNSEAINYPMEISSQVIKLRVSYDDKLVIA